MSFDTALNDLNTFLEQDAKDIIDLLKKYQKSSITVKTSISLNAYDCVVPFSVDPVKGVQANKDLNGKRGNYVFVMTKIYTRVLFYKRKILDQVILSTEEYPITLITGARQVGKTTLVSYFEKEMNYKYLSFDDTKVLEDAKNLLVNF